MSTVAPLIALDRIIRVEPGRRAIALRNVPHTLAIFDSHFPRRPVLPGVLVLGSMAELARVLLAEQAGLPWRLSGAGRVRYRHFIQPGDQMEIEVEMRDLDEQQATFKATVRVEERLVTSAGTLVLIRAARGGGSA
jgi:3-hydroxyacyl-[acyl-carrier-protein] dehydratase